MVAALPAAAEVSAGCTLIVGAEGGLSLHAARPVTNASSRAHSHIGCE